MLFLPMLEDQFSFAALKPLNGAITYPKKDSLNLPNWLSGKYQQKQEIFMNDMFGLRNFCVRLNNQIAYSLFGRAKANGVVLGKSGYLYEEPYINSYLGKDFIGSDSVEHTLERLKFVSDTLAKLNKQLIVIFAAGKGSYYPEFIPDSYKIINKNTNYKALAAGAKKLGVQVMDVNDWFMKMKYRSKYPLYPQYGIHWSKYGSVLVADSIIKTIEHSRAIDMPDLYYTNLQMKQPYGMDYDVGDGMNIIEQLKSFDMAYVDVKIEKDSAKTKPNVLMIADSFYWGIYDFGITNSFAKNHFWFYNMQVFPESFKEETSTTYQNLDAEIKSHDVIIIMATEANLRQLGWGFLESAEHLFRSKEVPHSAKYYERLKAIVDYIKHDAPWYNSVLEKARRTNTNIDVQIAKEAKWAVKEEGIY